jgi:hypothetical protein
MRFWIGLYLLVVGAYLVTASGRLGLADSAAMLRVSQSMLDAKSLSSDPCQPDGASTGCVPGVGERHYAGFGLVPSLAVIPAIFFARFVSGIVHIDSLAVTKVAVSLFTVLLAPLACVVLAAWIVKLGFTKRTALVCALILAFASPFWHFSVMGFLSEPYFTLAILVAAYLLSYPRRKFACLWAGLAFGVACGTRINGVILLPAYVGFIAFQARAERRALTRFVQDCLEFSASFSVCALLLGWANYARFGSPLKTGYHLAFPTFSASLSTPLLKGLSQTLFSPNIGLLFFAPWILIALFWFPAFVRGHRPESVLCGASALIYILFFAKFTSTYGGWIAGPRYLIPILPFFLLALAPALEALQHRVFRTGRQWATVRVTLGALVCAAFLMQAVGASFPDERYYLVASEFYTPGQNEPWWFGSITLASIHFLMHLNLPDKNALSSPGNQSSSGVGQPLISPKTENDFLSQFPDSVNLVYPNLLIFKLKWMGLPFRVTMLYLIGAIMILLLGAIQLRRLPKWTHTRVGWCALA